MAAAARIVVAVLLLAVTVPTVFGQTSIRCYYMTDAIPREPRPDDFQELEWSGGWSDFPLIPAESRDDVCIDSYHPPTIGTVGTLIIHMEEEIEEPLAIAKLNYQGSQTPFISQPMLVGSFNLLGPEIRNMNGEWFLYITQRQDYETPSMQRYMFDVRIDGEALTARVSLLVENIDDNDPIILFDRTCEVPELGDARLTDCIYQVYDADGRLSIEPMTFRIESERGANETFYIDSAFIPGDWYNMDITLGITQALNFETQPLHVFQLTALDSLPNTATVTIMVQVQNVEHRPPRWVEIFAVQQFDEKTYQNFTVRAIDGDTGIDKPIYYRLERDEADNFFSIETIPGGRDGAIFHVAPIDRDTLERELFTLSIIAYKYDNESFYEEARVVIIVNDINDQRPEPLEKEYFISFDEETPLTLNFETEFGFHDRDLGVHAQYEVHIESEYPPGAEEAFYIAPEVGYQRQTFIMGTLNHNMLDFEDLPFQNITLKVIATDIDNRNHTGEATVYISLINWNDELPIFELATQTVVFDETEGAGFEVATIRASDRDIGDRVVHTLMGNAGSYLSIDNYTGEIIVSIDNAFDYHRQNELFVQIRADDTLGLPYNTATTQLVIQLLDINNTPPTLRLPRGSPSVEENVPEGYLISDQITATDPDTTAYLQYEIDWDTSYATKQGRQTDPIHFHGCLTIETIFPDPEDHGSAIGQVVVQDIAPNITIDFEEFEVLYLTVRVRDLNTTLNEDFDESTFTIIITDMNDNPPIWTNGTLEQNFRVRERSASGVVIGSVLATDIDGPLYNQVRYTIRPREDTPEGLVDIDFYTGQMTVAEDGAIDADIPPRWNLYYEIIASDRCYEENVTLCPPDPTYWETPGNITIEIIDTNNREPMPDYDRFNITVYIYENAPDLMEVVQIFSIDMDRDEMYHTVSYRINYAVAPRLLDFFAVDQDTGMVFVQYTTNEVLDRDGDEPEHRIFLTLIDNFLLAGDGNRNQNTTEVLIVLLDENDNAPELPPRSELSWSISENESQGYRLSPEIYAPDRDEPDTPNSHVGYAILELTSNRDIEVPQLFNMVWYNNVTGELETAMDLRGYWGTYDIHIMAFDHGIPQQMSDEIYELVVRPYNFHDPEFVFPQDGTVIRLMREFTATLTKVNGDPLERLHATDEDGLQAGVVQFSVFGDDESVDFFNIGNEGGNLGSLMLVQQFSESIRTFNVIIRATDQGTEPGARFTDSLLTLIFVPTQGDPIFNISSYSVSFFEQDVGLTESFQLPHAEDPKNYRCTDDCYNVFYRIVDGNEAGHFALDPVENVITVVRELDREESESHTLTIAASNSQTPGPPQTGATLTLVVNVREAAPRPVFEIELYTAGISTADTINRELLTVQAFHSENVAITYTIDMESMQADQTLEAVRDSAFQLNDQTGVLSLNFQPTAAMHGMFEFNVVATDTAGEIDTAVVRVYIISSLNRVFFIFLNTVEQIENDRTFIAATFSEHFNMTCNIDVVIPATDASGVAQSTMTEARAHFIKDNLPVTVEEIEELRSDTQLLRTIQQTLNERQLILQDLSTEVSPDVGNNRAQLMIYALGGLATILAFMFFILLITFIVRTRALNRRLEAMSLTFKYGSEDSGLNRVGLAAPGTNKHAVEGSNPIWNEKIKAPDFDALSETSDDSDLIGIEDMPQFRSDYFPEDADDTLAIVNDRPPPGNSVPIATHSNSFGFNASPFSPDFANRQFKRDFDHL